MIQVFHWPAALFSIGFGTEPARKLNEPVWEELAGRLAAISQETAEVSLLFAEALQKQQHFCQNAESFFPKLRLRQGFFRAIV